MDAGTIAKITRQVTRTFPEMEGIAPSVRDQPGGKEEGLHLLTYKGKASLPGGRSLTRIVRVVADERGRIVRISTSR